MVDETPGRVDLAKKAGKYKGPKRALPAEKSAEARQRADAGESKTALAKDLGISRTTHPLPNTCKVTPPSMTDRGVRTNLGGGTHRRIEPYSDIFHVRVMLGYLHDQVKPLIISNDVVIDPMRAQQQRTQQHPQTLIAVQ